MTDAQLIRLIIAIVAVVNLLLVCGNALLAGLAKGNRDAVAYQRCARHFTIFLSAQVILTVALGLA